MANALPTWLSAPEPEQSANRNNQQLVDYNDIFMVVIDRIAKGQSFHQLVEEDHRNIDYNHFYRWIKKDPQRYALFQEAQELRTELMASEILRIADAEDSMEDVNRSRLRIDTRKFLMGAHNRKRYGESKQIEMTGNISISEALAQASARLIDIDGEVIEHDAEA